MNSAPTHSHTRVTVHSNCPHQRLSPTVETEAQGEKGERSASHSSVTWRCPRGTLILHQTQWGIPVFFFFFLLFRWLGKHCFREEVEYWGEERRWDVKYLCEIWSFKEKKGEGAWTQRSVFVCVVCSRCLEKAARGEFQRDQRRGWKVRADSPCCHLHKTQKAAQERERERKADRKESDSWTVRQTVQLRY